MNTTINVHRVVSVEIQRVEFSSFHELRITALNEDGAEILTVGFMSSDKIPPSIRELEPRKANEATLPSASTTPNQE